MSVVGFDFGNYASHIAVARQGGIDVITNDYSLHATPACVSFGPKSRVMGVAARQQVNTNFKNTVLNFKHLIGRKFNDPVTEIYRKYVPAKCVELPEGEIGFEVNYLGKTAVFTPEQVTAMYFHKLKLISEAGLGTKVNECVISVPYYFADNQRRALLAAAQIAGLKVLRIVNEPTAVGIAYGMYKGGTLPAEKDPSKIVAFVDIGHSCVQASLMAFNERKVQVLGASHDLTVGGLFFDDVIREEFHKQFIEKYKIDAKTNPRAWQRLLDECEKLKKQMSANSTNIPLNIECFMEDKDVSAKMQRAQFEELAEPLFQKIRDLLKRLLEETGVKIEDISEVEIIGGSSRIPLVRQIIAHTFNREPKTTMNQDEAVARGAGMQCAILSPSFKTKEFNVKDSFPFEIKLVYHSSAGQQEQVVYKRHDEFPFVKALTLNKKNAFDISAYYTDPAAIPYTEAYIGNWYVECTSPNGEERAVKVKLRLNGDGVFTIDSANSTEEVPIPKKEEAPQEPPAGTKTGDNPEQGAPAEDPKEQSPKEENAANGEAKDEAPKPEEKKTKKVIIPYEVKECVPFKADVEKFAAQEKEMELVDLNEKLTADSKNAVEEYCYNMRDQLTGSLSQFVTQEEGERFRDLLNDTENWLYDEGEEATKEVYDKRLSDLRSVIEAPIAHRRQELEEKQRKEAGESQQDGEAMDTTPPTATAAN